MRCFMSLTLVFFGVFFKVSIIGLRFLEPRNSSGGCQRLGITRVILCRNGQT